MAELGLVLGEIHLAEKKLRSWMKPRRVKKSLPQFPGKARQYPEPYGVVLIMSPWNYPLLLSLSPLIGAIAAGNCVVLKPSVDSPRTSRVMKQILTEALPDTVLVVEGGREENKQLLELSFDYIFFTGSTNVGKVVMRSAADHLTPLTLELGGKSPAIVDRSADPAMTAKRILFGKLMNGGQTCVAPDYLWVHESIKDELVSRLISQAKTMLSGDIARDYVRVINQKHRDRLTDYLKHQTILWQADIPTEAGHFPLTLVDQPDWDSRLMQEEIFGPILPIITFDSIDQVIDKQKSLPKPLALYLFTQDKSVEKEVLEQISFGGGCINDSLMQLSSAHLPFGGVGESGLGQYHGPASFDTFSHFKSVLHKRRWGDIPFKYLPYRSPDQELWHRILR